MTEKHKRTAEEFAAAVKSLGISELVVRECSSCGYALKYLFRGDKVFYDSGCHCVDYGPDIQPRSYHEVADYYNRQTSERVIADLNSVFGFTSLEAKL